MNKWNCILIIILTFVVDTAIAHKDFRVIKDYGNVKVRVKKAAKRKNLNL